METRAPAVPAPPYTPLESANQIFLMAFEMIRTRFAREHPGLPQAELDRLTARYFAELPKHHMIGPLDVLKDVVNRLERIGVHDYFLVGSLAAMHYGRPRFTNDVDMVLKLGAAKLQAFSDAFPLSDYYCPPPEILSDEVIRKGSFNLIHQKSGIKVDVVLSKPTPFYASEFDRRRKESASDFEGFVASPEDVIIKKLDFYREGNSEKHLTDIAGILAKRPIDEEYLNRWIEHFGLHKEWAKARET